MSTRKTKKKQWTTISEFGQAAEAAYQQGREDQAWTMTNTDPLKKLRQVTKMFLRQAYLESATPKEEHALLFCYRAGQASAKDRIEQDRFLFAPGAKRDEAVP